MRRDCMETMTTTSVEGLLPVMGNPHLVDRVGMKVAIATLVASLREDKNTANVQWDTVRKTPTWMRHLYESGRNYRSDAIMGGSTKKALISDYPSVGDWFACFARGCRARMGVARVQNEPLTSRIFLALDTIATEEWNDATTETVRETIEDVMCFVTFGFCNGLRGEEVPLVSLKGLLHFCFHYDHPLWKVQRRDGFALALPTHPRLHAFRDTGAEIDRPRAASEGCPPRPLQRAFLPTG